MRPDYILYQFGNECWVTQKVDSFNLSCTQFGLYFCMSDSENEASWILVRDWQIKKKKQNGEIESGVLRDPFPLRTICKIIRFELNLAIDGLPNKLSKKKTLTTLDLNFHMNRRSTYHYFVKWQLLNRYVRNCKFVVICKRFTALYN